ncbi:hypothetical protein LTR70_009762 [Exophiala xenobiotica]|uniref:CHRD domain-containing protein n=1 Tax=Lithohypha guttulata TaxID=1690604 RepID=A0ABR0JW01_9EURO|nr:hypothetical protein LTR24_009885 [Lithohypha guttulata]KAK5310055.1 hypothetical protein LTR70_009762 [Exophiala xenobiotica]
MRFSIVAAVAACATTVSAVPTPGWKGEHRPGWKTSANPFTFTSTYSVKATPDQVIGPDGPTGGLAGATGYYELGLNSDTNTICYNITLIGFRGDYQSAALTATHIHEAAKGATGPPRIAFPNPVGDEKYANSIGCIKGPFATGIDNADGVDTGAAFQVSQIEANPAGFFADAHSSLAVPGAVRGQIA